MSTIQLHKPTKILNTDAFNDLLVDAIQDIKGKNIVKLDMRHIHDRPADFFIICEGESNVQVRSIGENVRLRIKNEAALLPNHIEGQAKGLWVLVDYFNVIVHVFYKETRQFYELENLWSDAKVTTYQDI